MCGIVGAIGKSIDIEIAKDLFVAIEKRGTDAAGFWTPSSGIVKAPVKVSDFIVAHKEKFNDSVGESNVFIGHTRWATHGYVGDNNNNHPLDSENWILVHNGVISQARDVKDYPYKGGTDSENILAYVETFGLEKGLSKIGASAAIILVPKEEENCFYLWKTYSSDMAVCFFKDEDTLYVVSSKSYFEPVFKHLIKERSFLGGFVKEVTLDKHLLVTEPKARNLWKVKYENQKLNATFLGDISLPPVRYSRYFGGKWQEAEIDPDEDMFVPNNHRVRPARGFQTTEKSIIKNGNVGDSATSGTTYLLDYEDGYDPDGIYLDDIVKLKRLPTTQEWMKEFNYVGENERLISRNNPEDIIPGLTFSLDTLFLVTDFLDIDKDTWVEITDEFCEEMILPIDLLEKAPPPACCGIFYNTKPDCADCLFVDRCDDLSADYVSTTTCIGKYNFENDECKKCEAVSLCLSYSLT